MHESAPITFAAVSKTYRDFWHRARIHALRDFSLEVPRGRVVGLLGPNGSGKSTALKLLVGLLRPGSGTVRLNGADPCVSRTRFGLGYLPENNANPPFLSAHNSMVLYARLHGLERREARRRADVLLDRLALSHAAMRAAGTFSKGMGRRLGIAQCLVHDPEVLVLDEPTSGLDPIATEMVIELLRERKARGTSMLISSHLLGEIRDICDDIVILSGGSVRAHGSLEHLLGLEGMQDLRVQGVSGPSLAALENWCRTQGMQIVERKAAARSLADLYREVVKEPER